MVRKAVWAGLVPAAAALGTLLWGLKAPALWLDESASVIAVRRTWPALWRLLDGPEAPLVPYYILLKTFTGLVTRAGGAGLPPELLYRLPSVIAAVLAVWVLTTWLAGESVRAPLPLSLAGGAALILCAAFSRYGQEARPYAFVLLAAVLATVAWDRMLGGELPVRSSPGRVLVYALTVMLVVATHLLAVTLVGAHLVAAAWNGGPRGRRDAVGRTAGGAGLGLLLVSPFAVVATVRGVGPRHVVPVSGHRLWTTFLHVFTDGAHPFLGLGVVLVLALVGVTATVTGGQRPLARLALCLAVVPTAILVPVALAKPNLVMGRYLVFVLPGWAILAGLGVTTVAGLVAGGAEAALRPVTSRAAAAATVAAAVAGALVLGSAVAAQLPSLRVVRTTAGHGEDIRPALADANEARYAGLPVFATSVNSAIVISAYDEDVDRRLLGAVVQRDRPVIWPFLDPDYARRLSRQPRLVLLLRRPGRSSCQTRWPQAVEYVDHCMPRLLRSRHYRVETAQDGGHGWTFAVVTRERPPSVRMAAVTRR
jgi:hypothetical protein